MATEISGTCDERFIRFKDAFRAKFDDGFELGSSLAVCHRGKMVVDLWAGSADLEQTRPWQHNTIVRVNSTTKIPLIMSMLLLVDRGLIELDQRVAHYWPAFAANGKSEVSVRDLLTHQGGVPGFDPPVPFTPCTTGQASPPTLPPAHIGSRAASCCSITPRLTASCWAS